MFIVVQSAAYDTVSMMEVSDRTFELAFEMAEEGNIDEEEKDAFLDTLCEDCDDAGCLAGLYDIIVDILEDNLSKSTFYSGSTFFYESGQCTVGIGKTEKAAKLAYVDGLLDNSF